MIMSEFHPGFRMSHLDGIVLTLALSGAGLFVVRPRSYLTDCFH